MPFMQLTLTMSLNEERKKHRFDNKPITRSYDQNTNKRLVAKQWACGQQKIMEIVASIEKKNNGLKYE